jgi:hypothetical protein
MKDAISGPYHHVICPPFLLKRRFIKVIRQIEYAQKFSYFPFLSKQAFLYVTKSCREPHPMLRSPERPQIKPQMSERKCS